MAATLRSQTAMNGNGLTAVAQILAAAITQIDDLSIQYTQLTMATIFDAFPTAPYNPDGTLGTPDPAPNTDNPIDTRVITDLTRTMTAYEYGALLTGLQAVSALMKGQTVDPQPQMPQLLAKVVGG